MNVTDTNFFQQLPGEITSLITSKLPLKGLIAFKNTCTTTHQYALQAVQDTITTDKNGLLDCYDRSITGRGLYIMQTLKLKIDIAEIFKIAAIFGQLSSEDETRFASLTQQYESRIRDIQSKLSNMPTQC